MRDVRHDELLTTGQVAALLNVSRQHVVDLCDRGLLAFETTGVHRRVRRMSVDGLRSGTETMTRDQRRSLWLGYAVAGKLVRDPQRYLDVARQNLSKMQTIHTRGQGAKWLAEWALVLEEPVQAVLAVLTSTSPRAREMRQNTPFAGVLTQRERLAVLESFKETPSRSIA